MQYSSAENRGVDSDRIDRSQGTTARDYRRTDDGALPQHRGAASQGFKLSEKWFFRACRRAVAKNRGCSELQQTANEVEDVSTQTWEPWSRSTCVSKCQLQKSLTTVERSFLNLIKTPGIVAPPNDDYNRLAELKDPRYTDDAVASDRGSCRHDGRGVCESIRDRVFADMALQTDGARYKTVMCGSTRDRSVLVNKKAPTKRPLLSGASSSGRAKKETKKTTLPVKKRTSVISRAKKTAVKKSGKKGRKKIITPSNSRTRKSAAKKRTANVLLPVQSIAEKERNREVEDRKVENCIKIERISAHEYPEGKLSIPNEAFDAKPTDQDKVFLNRTENNETEPVTWEVSTCSTKCQGLQLQQRSDCIKLSKNSSSSSKKQFENGSTTTPEKADVAARRKPHRVKKKSTAKTPKAHSSRSTSSERESTAFPPRKKRPGKQPKGNGVPKSAGKSSATVRAKKSGATTSGIASTDDESNTTIPGNADSCNPRPAPRSLPNGRKAFSHEKAATQSSVMMIWHWLRERYRHTCPTATTAASSSGPVISHGAKDPFLCLFFPSRTLVRGRNVDE